MKIVAYTTKVKLVSRGTYSRSNEKGLRGCSRGDLQMYILDLQMAIVANATNIYKCKRAGAGLEHGGGCKATTGGCARLRSVAE